MMWIDLGFVYFFGEAEAGTWPEEVGWEVLIVGGVWRV